MFEILSEIMKVAFTIICTPFIFIMDMLLNSRLDINPYAAAVITSFIASVIYLVLCYLLGSCGWHYSREHNDLRKSDGLTFLEMAGKILLAIVLFSADYVAWTLDGVEFKEGSWIPLILAVTCPIIMIIGFFLRGPHEEA